MRVVLSSVVLCTVLAAGCSLARRDIQQPEVKLASLSLVRASLLEQELQLGLLVENPNDFALRVRGIEVDVDVRGEPVAHAVSDYDVTIPGLGSAMIPVTARTTVVALVAQALAARDSGDGLPYRIRGHVRLGNRFTPRVPFEREGTVDLR